MTILQHSSRTFFAIWIAACAIETAAAQGPVITTASLPNQTAGLAYSVTLAATGGTPPYSNWSVIAGALPPGLSLNSATGFISGSGTTGGVYGFWITVSDSTGSTATPQGFIVTIAPAPSVTAGTLPNGIVNTAYTATLTAAGGNPPYANWAVSSGNLPSGLMLNAATGVISGNPTNNGYYSFGVTVQDADAITSTGQMFSIAVGVTITTTSLPNWTIGSPYSTQLTASGGTPPYGAWTVASSTLPPGLTLSTSGLVSGIPTSTGGYSFTITASDAAGVISAPQPFTITIAGPLAVSTTSLPPGVVTVPYSTALALSGGTPPAFWAIADGALPPGLTLYSTTGVISGTPKTSATNPYSFTVQATDATGATATQQLSITVNQASLLVSPAGLTFNVSPQNPASLAAQTVSVFSNSGPVAYSATFSTTSGGNWLSVSGGGQTPGNLSVAVSTGGLASNTPYTGQITITGPTLPKAVIVPVTLNIAGTLPAQMSVAPASLTLDYAQGYAVDERYFLVTNTGSGTINYTASVQNESCGSWMNLLNSSGAASATSPGFVAVQVSPAGLSNQTCLGQITVTAGSQSQTIPVTMTVSALPQSVLLSQTALLFQFPYAGTPPPSQTFSVLNAGAAPIDWTLATETLSGGSWLSATPASGGSTTGSVPVPVTVSVDPTGLEPGQYYGSVDVTASNAGNGPQSVTVLFNVASQTPVQLTPAGVILVGQSATGVSETETVTLTNLGGNPLNYTSTVVADNHGNWLVVKPASGTVAAGGVATMTLQGSLAGLSAGVQHALLRAAFADGTIHTVDVYLIVPGTTGTPGCFANGFVAVFQSPEQGFQAVARTPVPLQVVAKDCTTGKSITRTNGLSAQVLLGPQNSTAIELIDDGTGTWTGTWTPSAPLAQTSLTAMIDTYANSTGSVVSGQAVVAGAVSAAPSSAASVVTGVVSGVSNLYPGVVTPGSPVSLHGDGMAGATATVAGPPYPTTLGGIQVLLEGQPLPLSYVDGKEVDAVIPPQVTANERQQLRVVRDSTMSAGVSVQVASPQPGMAK